MIPSEVGKMDKRDGHELPMTGWTGLWLVPGAILIIPAIVWFVKVQGALYRYWAGKAPVAEGPERGRWSAGRAGAAATEPEREEARRLLPPASAHAG